MHTRHITKQEQGANSLFTDRFLCLEVNKATQQLLNAINALASVYLQHFHSKKETSDWAWSEKTSIECWSIVRNPLILLEDVAGLLSCQSCDVVGCGSMMFFVITCDFWGCVCFWALSEGCSSEGRAERSNPQVKWRQTTLEHQVLASEATSPWTRLRSATYTYAVSPANPDASGRDWARWPSSLSLAPHPSGACQSHLGTFSEMDMHPRIGM